MNKTVRHYNYFKYALPKDTPESYARRAIDILRKLQQKFPQFYGNFHAPSEVLTLSGVRAFDTYYDLGKGAEPGDKAALIAYLREHDVWYVDEGVDIIGETNADNRYSLINLHAFKNIPEWHGLKMEKVNGSSDFWFWWLYWKDAVGGRMADLKLSPEWRNDWWAPHNITFGMLLGYPGEAICSLLYSDADEAADKEVLQQQGLDTAELQAAEARGAIIESDALISHADLFDGAWPTYMYHRQLRNNRNIKAHEMLWSEILTIVYREMGEIAE